MTNQAVAGWPATETDGERDSLLARFAGWAQDRHITLHTSFAIHPLQQSPSSSTKELLSAHASLTTLLEPSPNQYTVKFLPSVDDSFLPTRTVVASIPKAACFSHRSSSLAIQHHLPGPQRCPPLPDTDHATLRLASHLAYELSLGARSPWSPYLALLATRPLPELVLLLSANDSALQQWLRATEIERLTRIGRLPTLAQLQTHHQRNHGAISDGCDWETFRRAFTIVSSRAFHIDNFHSLALVPVADLFDHSDEPDVEMVTEDIVCGQCGSLGACAHDDDERLVAESALINDTVDMESVHPLIPPAPGTSPDELPTVFNTYGALPNARLLAEYGFILDANAHDVLHLELAVSTPPATHRPLLRALAPLFERDNELIGWVAGTHADATLIDAAAKVSPLLWLAAVHEAASSTRGNPAMIAELFDFQLSLAQSQPDQPSATCSRQLLSQSAATARLLYTLCRSRLAQYYLPHLHPPDLLALKDDLLQKKLSVSQHDRALLLVIELAASERILLETCASKWEDLEQASVSLKDHPSKKIQHGFV